jgi:undecaprenyl pyrophosphate phosphatase UppP
MEILVASLIIALLLGLLFRKKGDGILDTVQSGCWILVIIGVIILGYLIYNGSI